MRSKRHLYLYPDTKQPNGRMTNGAKLNVILLFNWFSQDSSRLPWAIEALNCTVASTLVVEPQSLIAVFVICYTIVWSSSSSFFGGFNRTWLQTHSCRKPQPQIFDVTELTNCKTWINKTWSCWVTSAALTRTLRHSHFNFSKFNWLTKDSWWPC